MKAVITTLIAGVLLLGVVWSPTIYQAALNHSFPSNPSVVDTSNGTIPQQYKVMYGAFFRDLAVVVKTDEDIKTTDQLLAGAQKAIKLFKDADNIPDFPTLNKQVNDKLTSAVGLASKNLDTDTRDKFATACNEIAASLGVK